MTQQLRYFFPSNNEQGQDSKTMARRPSDREEQQLILCFDVLDKILMDYVEEEGDVLNFILASKIYYEQFHDTLLFRNVLHGGCTALKKAAKRADKAMVKKILNIPSMETAAPRNIWPRAVNSARAHKDLVGILLQVDCVRASIDEEASELSEKGMQTWRERNYNDSWLRVMFDAIKGGQTDVVGLFLSLGLTVESYGRNGCSALHMAVESCQQVSLVKLLLEKYQADAHKLTVNWRPRQQGKSPLAIAIERNKTEVVELLLGYVDLCSGRPGTFCEALAKAAVWQHYDIIDILSRDERIDPNAYDDDGRTIMGDAVERGEVESVQRLLENGRFDPNATTAKGWSPLMIAAGSVCGLAMTKLLLSDKRADMFLRDGVGRNALFHAAYHGGDEVLEMYLQDGRLDPNEADENLNTPVLCTRDENCLLHLINDARVDLNKANSEGMTPLMQNVSLGLSKHVEQLLDSGRVDVNLVNHEGNTAMMMAISRQGTFGRREEINCRIVVRCMLGSGRVKLDLVNANGETALMMAVKTGNTGVVEMILAMGDCMMDFKDAQVVTMVRHAIRNDDMEMLELLLRWVRLRKEAR
ncbi:putative ankyrin repeat protein [Trichoderma atroviride IMI 206040]|uniref:Ankyrin repeat protein n=1 Tax=Hypocrea atroviridis (strain ATCC 20476 / IMI 206040) TaxID=452589 RepID=G9P3G6_HYPAI|nr:putative ankyrin repeat protein [Trichoderma atroviride IMI 206040]EHK42925.1 putative ankyrin repeat protein [Trichoderma atroviride IMI 206040]